MRCRGVGGCEGEEPTAVSQAPATRKRSGRGQEGSGKSGPGEAEAEGKSEYWRLFLNDCFSSLAILLHRDLFVFHLLQNSLLLNSKAKILILISNITIWVQTFKRMEL